MTDYPTMVYRIPGKHRGPKGHTHDYLGVADADAMKKALANGWHKSQADALAALTAPKSKPAPEPEPIDEISPATRDELEQKAKELGVKFNARTSDAKLAERIAEALS